MKILTNVLDRIPVDNKLITSFLTLALTRLGVALLGVDADDELLTLGVPLAAAAIVGYRTHNEGSVLRAADEEDGNPVMPDDESVPGELELDDTPESCKIR